MRAKTHFSLANTSTLHMGRMQKDITVYKLSRRTCFQIDDQVHFEKNLFSEAINFW